MRGQQADAQEREPVWLAARCLRQTYQGFTADTEHSTQFPVVQDKIVGHRSVEEALCSVHTERRSW